MLITQDMGATVITQYTSSASLTSIETIEHALNFIPADDRDTWIKCGMAIKAELGDAGLDTWDRWSASSDSYRARDAAASWRSFKASGAVSIGTLFHIAKQYGYQFQSNNKPVPLSPEAIAKRDALRNAEASLQIAKRKAASDKATSIWNASPSTPEVSQHGYLKRKCIQPHGTKIYHGNLKIKGMACHKELMIPMMIKGKVSSLQFINHDGEKRFFPGGGKGGFLIGKIVVGKPICIAEGFATGASIHEATGYPVVVAFDAGNLSKIANALRTKQPDAVIILCADDDEAGRSYASKAARAIGGVVALPDFSKGANRE